MEDHKFENCYVKNDGTKVPMYELKHYLVNGKLIEWTGQIEDVYSPLRHQGSTDPIKIGSFPILDADAALSAFHDAQKSWNNGRGEWATCGPLKRIEAVEKFVEGLKKKRDEIANLIMWEICKTKADAEKEVDRTITYIKDTIKELKELVNRESSFKEVEGYVAQIRRAPLGVVLCVGPFNYPLNETYTTLIPALIMGNSVILKLPRTGVLCHAPTIELFQKCFPAGVISIISGAGKVTLPAIMKQKPGVDVFAMIGTSKAADEIQRNHPQPHRLRVCLGLEAKNTAIILPDADLEVAVSQCILGSLNYNGQRCTAIKIIFVHSSIKDEFLQKFTKAVDGLKMGLPWEENVKITPLAESEKPKFLSGLVEDAKKKGAKIVNSRSGMDQSTVAPTVLFPVDKSMRIYHEEQFGPVIPVTTFNELEDVFQYLSESEYGLQVAIFGKDASKIGALVDVLVNCVSRVNINCQCQRGPDALPFTGRKDSAYGTLSVSDALRVFSIRSLVSTLAKPENTKIVDEIVHDHHSTFLRLEHLF